MKEKKIRLMATEDVQEFVNAAERCEFDIDVLHERVMIDAKSLLGVLGIGLSKELTVKYWGENSTFENVIDRKSVV